MEKKYDRDFNFDQLSGKIKEFRGIYTTTTDKWRDFLTKEVKFHSYLVNYAKPLHRIFATDGSHITYWKLPSDQQYVAAVRVGYVEQQYIISPQKSYENLQEGAHDEFVFMKLSDTVNEDGERVYITPKTVLETVMEAREKQTLYNYAASTTDQMIMVDGSLSRRVKEMLTARTPPKYFQNIVGEELYRDLLAHSSIKDLATICLKNRHILVGVSKDSGITHPNGMKYETLVEHAAKIQGLDCAKLYYYDTEEDVTMTDEKKTPLKVLYVKLHPKAQKWHRVDYLMNGHDLETDILPTIAHFSQFNRIYGTPVPPQICHKYAVQLRHLADGMKKKLIDYLIQGGFTTKDAWNGLTDVNGELLHAITYHYKLDRL